MSNTENSGLDNLLGKLNPKILYSPTMFVAGGLTLLILSGVVRAESLDTLAKNYAEFSSIGLVLLSILVAQLIISLVSLPVLKLLEGYNWHLLSYVHRVLCERNRRKLESIVSKLQHHEQLTDTRVAELQLELQFMPRSVRVLPTSVGNILRSGEDYPFERFGIPGIRAWPHLWLCLPTHARIAIGARYEEINLCVQSLIWSVLFPCWSFVLPSYWKLMPIAIAITWTHLNYRKLKDSAKSYTSLFRSLFDLYRFNLYDKLHLPKPNSPLEELLAATKSTSTVCQFLTSIPNKEVLFIHSDQMKEGESEH